MNITKEIMDAKLLQIANFEAKWGENTRTRAMKKYCTNEKYRNRRCFREWFRSIRMFKTKRIIS